MEKKEDAFRTISEAAEELDLPPHVLRFWETRFPQVKPLKRGGGRRYYRPADIELLQAIRTFLYDQGYTIKGVQRLLQEKGARGSLQALKAIPSEMMTSVDQEIPAIPSEENGKAILAEEPEKGEPETSQPLQAFAVASDPPAVLIIQENEFSRSCNKDPAPAPDDMILRALLDEIRACANILTHALAK